MNGNKTINMADVLKQKEQIELQKQSFIATTRLRLAETYLNTLLGRLDIDLQSRETRLWSMPMD